MRNWADSKKLLALAFIVLQSAGAWAGPTQPTAVLGCPAGRIAASATQNLESLDYELIGGAAAEDPGTRAVQLAERGPHSGGAIPAGEDYDAIRAAQPTTNEPPTTSLQIRPDPSRGVVYTAPPRRISSAMMKAAPREAPATTYVVTGKPAMKLAQEAVKSSSELEEIGKGGMQVVYADPTDASKVIKVYDGEVMWGVQQKPYLKRIAEGKELIATGDAVKMEKGKEMILSAETELKKLQKLSPIPPGKTYPPRFDDIAARMVQRTKALGMELRNDVLPKIKIPRTDGAGDIKISMCDGLETVSETGVSRVEKVHVGPVDPANPASDQWVEAPDYFKNLTPDSRRYQKVMDVDKSWRDALSPFNDRIKDANQSMGIPLNKGGKALGYDIGEGGRNNPLTNVFIRVDAKGTIVEIKVSDF